MSLPLSRVDCVALGSFNPAILQPHWFMQHGLLPTEPAALRLGADGLQLMLDGVGWMASLERFVVVVDATPNEVAPALIQRPSDMVARTFELLHHTPVTGVGHNFSFDLLGQPAPASWLASCLAASSAPPVASGEPALFQLQLRYQGVVQGATVAMTYIPAGPRRLLSFNVHRVVGNSQEAVEAARRGAADLAEIRAWLTQISSIPS